MASNTIRMIDQFGQHWDYRDIPDAAERTGLSKSLITARLKSGKPISMGTHEMTVTRLSAESRSHMRRQVLMTLGDKSYVFKSVSECARYIDHNRDYVIRHIATGCEAIIDHKVATFDYLAVPEGKGRKE